MKKTILLCLLLLHIVPLALVGEEIIEAIEAVEARSISVRAVSANGYQETKVEITNKTDETLSLDFSTLGLIPSSGPAQRIGLTRNKDDDENIVQVAPHRKKTVTFESRCLDKDRKAPSTGDRLTVEGRLPRYISKLLRENADQDEVWAATDGTHKESWKRLDRRPPVKNEDDLADQIVGKWVHPRMTIRIRANGTMSFVTPENGQTGTSDWVLNGKTLLEKRDGEVMTRFKILDIDENTLLLELNGKEISFDRE